MVKIGISGMPAPSFIDYLDLASKLGFKWIELPSTTGLFSAPGGDFWHVKGYQEFKGPDFEPEWITGGYHFSPEFADPSGKPGKKLKELLNSYDIKVDAIYVPNEFVKEDRSLFDKEVQRVKDMCDVALFFDCNVVRVHGGAVAKSTVDRIGREKCLKMIIEGFKSCIKYAEDRNVSLAMENHLTLVNDAETEIEIVKEVNSDNFGVNIDTGNFLWYGHTPDRIKQYFEALAPYAKHTHLKDAVRKKDKTGIGEVYFTPLGEGEVPIKFLVDLLRKRGYKGAYNLQCETLRIGPCWNIGAYEGVRRSYNYLLSIL
jgi:sugar phosphate isomerase/epimerase